MTAPMMSVSAQESQETFRAVLDVMSRPGTLRALPAPRGEDGRWGAALVALQALLDHEVSFHVVDPDPLPAEQLLRRTGSRSAPLAQADFVLASGASAVAAIQGAKEGPFEEPERSATVVLAVDALLTDGLDGVLGTTTLELRGPGIRDCARLMVLGADEAAFAALEERNATFPHGIDVILVTPAGVVSALPRSTHIETLAPAPMNGSSRKAG